jgi:hypothetical protein
MSDLALSEIAADGWDSGRFANLWQERLYEIDGTICGTDITYGLQFADGVRQNIIEIITSKDTFARQHIEQGKHQRTICVGQLIRLCGLHDDPFPFQKVDGGRNGQTIRFENGSAAQGSHQPIKGPMVREWRWAYRSG